MGSQFSKGAKPTYIKDRFGEIDYAASSAHYTGADKEKYTRTRENKNGKTITTTGTRYTQDYYNRKAIADAKAGDTGYTSRQQTLLSSNSQTDNTNQVNTGEDINIGASDAPDVTGGAGKRRKQGKGAMSATLGIT